MTGDSFDSCASTHHMFGRISGTYDLANRIITFGRDRRWRRFVVEAAGLKPGGRVLDVGCGTGDISFEVHRQVKNPLVVAADLSLEMMLEGIRTKRRPEIKWCLSDALNLPFRDACFDSVLSGYLVRNVPDTAAVFREQMRVVKPGGRVVCLETCPPPAGAAGFPVRFYMALVIPLIGRIISGDPSAYRYLHQSTARFMEPTRLASVIAETGLDHLFFRKFMFGTQAVHVAERR